MAQSSHAKMQQAKPAADIYTVLMLIAIVALITAIVAVAGDLMGADGYGLTFSQLLEPVDVSQIK